jgi:hypothetical protein
MDNPETMTILTTQDTRRRQTKQKHNTTQKSKKDEQHGPYTSGAETACPSGDLSSPHVFSGVVLLDL